MISRTLQCSITELSVSKMSTGTLSLSWMLCEDYWRLRYWTKRSPTCGSPLASEACVPVRSFPFMYDYFMNSRTSFVEAFSPKPWYRRWETLPHFRRDQLRKGELWNSVHRRHAGMIVGDVTFYRKFKADCIAACTLDEEYVQTLLFVRDPEVRHSLLPLLRFLLAFLHFEPDSLLIKVSLLVKNFEHIICLLLSLPSRLPLYRVPPLRPTSLTHVLLLLPRCLMMIKHDAQNPISRNCNPLY